MRITARTFDRFMSQLVSRQLTHFVVNYGIEKVGWVSHFVAELAERPKSDNQILNKLDHIIDLESSARRPASLSLPVFVSQRSIKEMDIRKYRLPLGPVGTEEGDTVAKAELLIESTDGLSPTLADVGLPTVVEFGATADSVEFELIENRVYSLRTRYTDNDDRVGLSDPLEFTSVDDTGPSVPTLQEPVFVSQREIPDPAPTNPTE